MSKGCLIGMTTGARKRAARMQAACDLFDDDDISMWAFRMLRHPEYVTPGDRRAALRAFVEYQESAQLRWAYVAARMDYRLRRKS